jgi:hypothetical protein
VTWAVLAILMAAPAIAGCYKPSIEDGKLGCGPALACPDGFACVSSRCWQGGIARPLDGGAGDTDQPADMSDTDVSCVVSVPECVASSTGICDPVCQTGCGCQEKCSISSVGQAACVPVRGQQPVEKPCRIDGYGSPDQTDTCTPGDVCLYPGGPGTTSGYCFALCSSDLACPNSRCVSRPVAPPINTPTPITPMATVCDTPFVACDPFTNAGCTNPDRPNCYLAPPDPATGASRTLCEYFAGPGKIPDTCDWSRDCIPRFVCPRNDDGATWPRANFCLPVCDSAHPCTSGGTCKYYGTTYGYCVTM